MKLRGSNWQGLTKQEQLRFPCDTKICPLQATKVRIDHAPNSIIFTYACDFHYTQHLLLTEAY